MTKFVIAAGFLALAQCPLAEILELGLQAQQAVVGIGELLAQARSDRFGRALRDRLGLEQTRLALRARGRRRGVALADRLHRLAQRRLELGIDRNRPALVGRRLRALESVADNGPADDGNIVGLLATQGQDAVGQVPLAPFAQVFDGQVGDVLERLANAGGRFPVDGGHQLGAAHREGGGDGLRFDDAPPLAAHGHHLRPGLRAAWPR